MEEKMNLYQKLNQARLELKQASLKKTGNNTYVGFKYFELGDFLPKVTELENKYKYITLITFTSAYAEAKVVNIENPEEVIFIQSPMSTADLKSCLEVQNLGAVETYIRRYLYNLVYEIVESDALDAVTGKEKDTATTKTETKASEPGWRLQPATEDQKKCIVDAQVAITEEKFNSLTKGEAYDIIAELRKKGNPANEFKQYYNNKNKLN